MVVRLRRFLPICLLAVLILGDLRTACAQNNSLFPKGGPNRTLPQATPLPRGASRLDNSSSAAASSSARRRPAPPPRSDTVALPYNLVWFDNQNRLASLFAGVGAKVTDKKTEGPSEVWAVKDLIAPNLRTSFFTFQQGLLIGLEFDYGQDAWETDKYNEVMGQFRRLLETKCESPGEIISRKTDQAPGTAIKETLMGYQWTRGDTSVQLFYYAAEDTAKALNFRSISVHYHYRDPFGPPPGSEQPNAPAPGAQPSPGGQTASVSVTPSGPDNSPGGALPLPDNAPAPSPKPAPTPGPSPAAAVTPPAETDDGMPGPEPVEISEDKADAAAAMAPAPSPTATPTPSPSPTPKKSSSGRRRR